MTEREWLASNSLYQMLKVVEDERKLRLFAVACCRKFCHLFDINQTVEVAERIADGQATREEIEVARAQNFRTEQDFNSAYVFYTMLYALTGDTMQYAVYSIANALDNYQLKQNRDSNEREEQRNLLRNIVNPFHKPTNHSIQAGNLADVIYKSKDWQALTVLADLLEEEGCEDTKLLNHLRTKDQVYRGWWSLDAVR